MEIWDKVAWDERQQAISQHISEISENLGAFDVDFDF